MQIWRGKHLLRIKIDERKNQRTCARELFYATDWEVSEAMQFILTFFHRNLTLLWLVKQIKMIAKENNSLKLLKKKTKNEALWMMENFIKFPALLPIYFRCSLTAIIKNNMMNFFPPHFDGLKWLMIVENCMIFKILPSSTSYKSRSKYNVKI